MRVRTIFMKKHGWMLSILILLLSAATAGSDDTDILGVSTMQVEPNVLIIFDTSASMAIEDVPAHPYRSEFDYGDGQGYARNAVYRWQNNTAGARWVKLVDGAALDRTCLKTGLSDRLGANGQAWARINTGPPHDCGDQYEELDLRTGNYLNYENRPGALPMRDRLDAAKEAVKKIIDDHPDIRFGLMRFKEGNARRAHDTEGGRISDHGDINLRSTAEQLKADIDTFAAETFTPLAETLAEAGLYFAGQRSWFNDLTYTSPIDIKCRPNFIILMTDGESTQDQDPRLGRENGYINGGTIGDYDGDGNESAVYALGGTDYVDDVAAYLYDNDLMPRMGRGDPLYEKQNIVTHTIGFKHAHRLLKETADNGGGRFVTAGSADGLSRAFEKIFNDIEHCRHVYVSPTVPVSRENGVYAGNYLYTAMFKPDVTTGRWRGNLKKYRLDQLGRLLDKNSRPAVGPDGVFLDAAQSYWSEAEDGARVDAGGAGALLVNHPSRKLYTYIQGAEKNLTADINAFSIANQENIPPAVLGVSDDEERRGVIDDIHGVGKEWAMADVLHSEPAVLHYDTNGNGRLDRDDDALVFVGTNGGVMHAFSDRSGHEQWGFIPPQQLGRLKRLSDRNKEHDYFLDGPPVAVTHDKDNRTLKTLVFGERRGGNHYYALDVTSYNEPYWKFHVGSSILGEDAEQLGQSWGRPQPAAIATGPSGQELVLLLPGGYDTNQDAETPADNDTVGRAVFSVEIGSGAPGPFQFYHDGENSDMTHCIVDLIGVDTDGDGITNSIYAPDLGGNMFAFTDSDAAGSWRKLRLFDASTGAMRRKIFCSPDVVRIMGDPMPGDDKPERKAGEMIYFGTGDRAHPNERIITNRFYAVKNFWWRADGFCTLTDHIAPDGSGDLHDATPNLVVQGTAEERAAATDEIKDRMGWFIDLEAPGEKVVSSPVVYNRTVYFTTFVPGPLPGEGVESTCEVHTGGRGVARLYGLDYKDGRAVHDHWSDVVEYLPDSGEEIKSGAKSDRHIEIGHSIPSAPMIAIHDGVAMLYVGVAGRLVAIAPKNAVEMNEYYWRESRPFTLEKADVDDEKSGR